MTDAFARKVRPFCTMLVMLGRIPSRTNSVLTGTGAQNAYVKVTRVSGSQPFIVYGVVNDGATNVEGTNDGSYVGMSR